MWGCLGLLSANSRGMDPTPALLPSAASSLLLTRPGREGVWCPGAQGAENWVRSSRRAEDAQSGEGG